MPSDEQVIEAIVRNLSNMHAYSQWHVGTTDHPDRIQTRLHYPAFWRTWVADSKEDATRVVEYFTERGMQPDPDQGAAGNYVYLF